MIRRVDSREVDFEKFTKLKRSGSDDIFSEKDYFLPLCKYWFLLVIGDYDAALVVPFNRKGPLKWVTTPLFYRASYWIGNWSEESKQEAIDYLKRNFRWGSLNIGFVDGVAVTKSHQILLTGGEVKNNYSSLAKRMLKKAESHNISYHQDFDITQFTGFLMKELSSKVEGINSTSMDLLNKLLQSLKAAKMLYFEGAVIGGEFVGGLLIVKTQGRHLYLKGTATSDAKKKGVYYALMNRAILRAKSENAIFDFGGSEISGVAQFNHNFGAQDMKYCQLLWGKKPLIYTAIQRMNRIWK